MTFEVRKYGAVVQVSRDDAIEYGLIEPTEEERAERAERRARHDVEWKRRKKAVKEAWPVFVAALAAVTDPVARAVLDLHHADGGTCAACEDYEGYGPSWPCETVETVAKALGIDVPPDLDLVTIADNG